MLKVKKKLVEGINEVSQGLKFREIIEMTLVKGQQVCRTIHQKKTASGGWVNKSSKSK